MTCESLKIDVKVQNEIVYFIFDVLNRKPDSPQRMRRISINGPYNHLSISPGRINFLRDNTNNSYIGYSTFEINRHTPDVYEVECLCDDDFGGSITLNLQEIKETINRLSEALKNDQSEKPPNEVVDYDFEVFFSE